MNSSWLPSQLTLFGCTWSPALDEVVDFSHSLTYVYCIGFFGPCPVCFISCVGSWVRCLSVFLFLPYPLLSYLVPCTPMIRDGCFLFVFPEVDLYCCFFTTPTWQLVWRLLHRHMVLCCFPLILAGPICGEYGNSSRIAGELVTSTKLRLTTK